MDFNTRFSPKDLGAVDSYAEALVHPLLANSTLYPSLLVTCHRNDKDSACFYHSDYFVSTSYLTDNAGNVSQTLNYLPYGEDWVDLHYSLDYRLGQYTFNGKEKDYESGFHYYGARYYWSELLTE